MELKFNVAISATKVNTQEVTVEIPEEDKYFRMVDEGIFFPRGVVLFAMKKRGKTGFLLICVERGKQDYTDFIPTKDCRQEYWLTENSLRKTAFDILTNRAYSYKEITKDAFDKERNELIEDPFNR